MRGFGNPLRSASVEVGGGPAILAARVVDRTGLSPELLLPPRGREGLLAACFVGDLGEMSGDRWPWPLGRLPLVDRGRDERLSKSLPPSPELAPLGSVLRICSLVLGPSWLLYL